MNISLPENLKEFVVAQAATGGYSTPSELIRDDQKKKLEQRLSLLLLERLADTAYWNAKRQALAAES